MLQSEHYFLVPPNWFPFSFVPAFSALSMARVAAKTAMSFERWNPVCILVGPRCAIHFQPAGLVICTSSYLTPRCSMVEQRSESSKVPLPRDPILRRITQMCWTHSIGNHECDAGLSVELFR